MYVRAVIKNSKMSQFDAATFMSEPSEDSFAALKKDELISLAKHLKLEVKKAMKKHEIQYIVLEHLVSEGVFKETVLEKYEVPKSGLSGELQLQYKLKKLEMEERLQEKERQERLEREEKARKAGGKGTTRKAAGKGTTREAGGKGTTREVRERENGIAA